MVLLLSQKIKGGVLRTAFAPSFFKRFKRIIEVCLPSWKGKRETSLYSDKCGDRPVLGRSLQNRKRLTGTQKSLRGKKTKEKQNYGLDRLISLKINGAVAKGPGHNEGMRLFALGTSSRVPVSRQRRAWLGSSDFIQVPGNLNEQIIVSFCWRRDSCLARARHGDHKATDTHGCTGCKDLMILNAVGCLSLRPAGMTKTMSQQCPGWEGKHGGSDVQQEMK